MATRNNNVVYLHKKPCGEVFYVGIGYKKRSIAKDSRNRFWHNIVDKHGYEVEIIAKSLPWELACNIEIALIKDYGRRDLGTGTLCNLTDGGEGYAHWAGKKLSLDHRANMSKSNKSGTPRMRAMVSKQITDNNPKSRIVLDNSTGIYYNSVMEASKFIDMKYGTLKAMLRNENPNKTNLIYV